MATPTPPDGQLPAPSDNSAHTLLDKVNKQTGVQPTASNSRRSATKATASSAVTSAPGSTKTATKEKSGTQPTPNRNPIANATASSAVTPAAGSSKAVTHGMVGEVKEGLRLVNTLMRPPFTLNENKLSSLNADTLDRMAKDHGATMLPVREAIVALAFELGVNDVQVARKHALSFMDGFRLPEVQELYDQHVIDHDFYRALAIEVSDCAKRQQESVARALQKQKEDEKAKEMLRKKQEQEKAKEMLRKKQESEKKLNDAINDALKKNRERLSEERPNFSELEVIEYMALMRFTPMALELLYSTSDSTSLTPADVVNAIKMVHPGLTVVDENTKWVDVEDAFERLAKCTSTKPKDRLFRLLSLAEQGAPTIPKLQDHWKKRSAEEEAEGRTDAKRQC
jgi:hypothetical protein